MNTLTRHLLVAATAALAVAAALTLIAQEAVAAPGGEVSQATAPHGAVFHANTPTGEALLLAAADVFCPGVSGS